LSRSRIEHSSPNSDPQAKRTEFAVATPTPLIREPLRLSSATTSARDIQGELIEYVTNFVKIGAGKRFNPQVTIGVGTEAFLNKMLAEPFPTFTFSVAGASVYQLGTFGTARKELKALTLTP